MTGVPVGSGPASPRMIPSSLRRNDLHVSSSAALERYSLTMNALGDTFRSCGNASSCAWQVLRYFGGFPWLIITPSVRTKDSMATRPFRTPNRRTSPAPRSSSPRPSSADFITPAAASPPERVPRGFGRSATLAGRGRVTSPRWQNGPSTSRCALFYSPAQPVPGPKPTSLPSATRDAPLRRAPHCPDGVFRGDRTTVLLSHLPK